MEEKNIRLQVLKMAMDIESRQPMLETKNIIQTFSALMSAVENALITIE